MVSYFSYGKTKRDLHADDIQGIRVFHRSRSCSSAISRLGYINGQEENTTYEIWACTDREDDVTTRMEEHREKRRGLGPKRVSEDDVTNSLLRL
ncbi:hypothetical protein TIFTF001_054177 [Ficus carica]|uniref:Uncharacterized protein n=1 Tax=Ficus carica TaxID=3494 RepID=A0AA88ECN1_FICCA|nr:hypothetical protein TIFTF001_054174 [Ficus carica]GMN71941.1 hypothetical protein TIFTF001_054175 [Ficus carica]GMN71942.1 hypothetical protein TIFTF001_054176 [Ficus carica]GMN71948.1 hypothetical protein TIFTF001_054177 [Ficus carica]